MKAPRFLSTLWLILVLVAAVSCSKQGPSRGATSGAEPLSPHRELEGSLVSNVNQIIQSQWAENCDRTDAERELELARALDARTEELKKVTEALPPDSEGPAQSYRRVSLPPTYVREAVRNFGIQPGWHEEPESWNEIYQEYLKIKDEPTHRNWISLNASVRAIIVDDQTRISGLNMYLDKDSGPILEATAQAVQKCSDAPNCILPFLTEESQAFVKGIRYYDWYWMQLTQETDPSKNRELIAKFAHDLTADLTRYQFIKNPGVTIENGEITLPLDPGPFSISEDAIAGYIERVWKSDTLHLKIRWTSASEMPDVFKILLGDITGGRSFVSLKKHIVNLFPDVRAKSIAHEIGHVLGFNDHYYTVWHPSTCSYITQSTDEDLMSEPDTGTVTADEWAELSRRYQKAN